MSQSGKSALAIEGGGDVSFQVYQDVYNRITGRSEKIRKFFFEKHLVTLEHILNLNHAIEQGVEQYTCHSSSVSISVSYVDGTSERWSSFEKFKLQAPTKSVCAESVEIEYDFLITLPKLTDPRPYKIEVGVRSEVGFLRKLDLQRASSFERKMAQDLRMGTARLSVSYVDLVVARSFEAFVTSWFEALPKQSEGHLQTLIRWICPASGIFTRLLMIVTAAVLCWVLFSVHIVDLASMYSYGIVTAVMLMLTNILGLFSGDVVKTLFSSFAAVSSVRLSEADDKAKADLKGKTSQRLVLGLISWIGIVLTGLIINHLSNFLSAQP